MTTSRLPRRQNPSPEPSSFTGRPANRRPPDSSSAKAPTPPPPLPPDWPPVSQQPKQLPPPQYGLLVPPPQFGRFSRPRQFSQLDRPAQWGVSRLQNNPGALAIPPPAWPGTTAAARTPGPLAGFGPRAISFLIDCVAPLIVLNLLPIAAVAGGMGPHLVIDAVAYLGLLGFGVWNSGYLQGTTGRSLGRRLAGTKLVSIDTGQPVGFGRALTRQICHVLDLGTGFLRPLWNVKRQTFADKIVGTVVVHLGEPTNPRGGAPTDDLIGMKHRRLGE
jgi:uncharacterized RDD family membrane protein YckC